MILEGHGRLMAAKKMGMVKVPVVVLRGLSDKQKRAYTLIHNKLTMNSGFNEDILASELKLLDEGQYDLSLTGFSEKEVDELLKFEDVQDNLDDDLSDAPDELPGMMQLKNELLLNPDEYLPPFGFPELSEECLAEPHDVYQVWIGANRTTDAGGPLYYLYGSDSTLGMDATRTTVSFFVDDIRFERVWNNIAKYTTKFIMARTEALIMPDYSLEMFTTRHAVNIWNAYRCFYVARYWQDAGLSVVPNIKHTGNPDELEPLISPIPKNAPLLATQIQTARMGWKAPEEYFDMKRTMLGLALEQLKPLHLLVYGGEPGLTLGKEICARHGVKFIGVLNRAASMRGDVAVHEKVRAF